jgi:hypothetical protein
MIPLEMRPPPQNGGIVFRRVEKMVVQVSDVTKMEDGSLVTEASSRSWRW